MNNTTIFLEKIQKICEETFSQMRKFDSLLSEDWQFEPRDFSGLLPTIGSEGPQPGDVDSAMPKYTPTTDAGIKKTKKITKKMARKNKIKSPMVTSTPDQRIVTTK